MYVYSYNHVLYIIITIAYYLPVLIRGNTVKKKGLIEQVMTKCSKYSQWQRPSQTSVNI